MKRIKISFSVFLLFTIFLLNSCADVKDIAYFQRSDNNNNNNVPLRNQKFANGLYEAHIKPKDLLSITVVSTQPEASMIYNLLVPTMGEGANQNALFQQPTLQSYLVDNDGNIDFPVFGKIPVVGLTRKGLEALLINKLSSAFSKETPIVTIRFVNYSVNILGEVSKPGKYDTTND